jgi:predicted nicotinamide N-methyase
VPRGHTRICFGAALKEFLYFVLKPPIHSIFCDDVLHMRRCVQQPAAPRRARRRSTSRRPVAQEIPLAPMLACVTALSTRSSVVVRLPAVRCSMPSERAAVGAGLILSEAAHDASSKMGSEEDTTGGKIWDSGRVLASVLEEEYASRLSGMAVLELGSGTGIGGLTAALAGATVTLTDGSLGVLPLLEANVRVNGLSDQSTVQRLRWGFRYRDDLAALDQNLDLVIGSDLLYSPDVFPDLLDTLEELCTPSHTEVLVR